MYKIDKISCWMFLETAPSTCTAKICCYITDHKGIQQLILSILYIYNFKILQFH